MSMIEICQKTRSGRTLFDFVAYCIQHPDERFWQALRNWSGYSFVLTTETVPYEVNEEAPLRDTFYLEGRRHDKI